MLESNAESFGENRFQQENKTMSEALRKIGDLEGDERSLAGDSGALAQEMDEKLAKELAAEMDQFLAETREKLEKLRSRLGTPAPRELADDGAGRAEARPGERQQMRRLLPEREWGEVQEGGGAGGLQPAPAAQGAGREGAVEAPAVGAARRSSTSRWARPAASPRRSPRIWTS